MQKNLTALCILIVVIIVVADFIFAGKNLAEKASRIQQNTHQRICSDCNVILLSVDSLRADHVGAFGYYRNTTPNFDKFAKTSALFLNYFSTSFLTPVSEMSVQTGLYPASHGVTNFDTVLPRDRVTITQYLKGKNYTTSAILSSPEFRVYPALFSSFSRGFDRYLYYFKPGDEDKLDKDSFFKINNAYKYRQFPSQDILSSEFDKLGSKRFFLWLAVGGVHWPYGMSGQNIYADKNYDGIFKGKTLDWGELQNTYKGVYYPAGIKLQQADVQYVRDMYDNGVRAFDDFLGHLVSELKRRDLLRKTIVVIESEHGEDLNEHGYFAHYDVFDTQIHTPLLIFMPSVRKGQRILSFSSSVDIFPTLAELFGDTVPNIIQGESLVPIIEGKEQDGQRQEVFIERNPLWEEANLGIRQSLEARGIKVVSGKYKDIAVRTPEWKYILRMSKKRLEELSWWKGLVKQDINLADEELYNLIRDPMETDNVIEAYPKEAKILRNKLENWYAAIRLDSPEKIQLEREIQPYF